MFWVVRVGCKVWGVGLRVECLRSRVHGKRRRVTTRVRESVWAYGMGVRV